MRSPSGSARASSPIVWVLAFVAGVAAGPCRVVAQEDHGRDLARLLKSFAGLPGLSARFRETKNLELLSVPVESKGVLHFDPPRRLLRRVESPRPSAALIRGDRLIFESRGEIREIDLSDNAVVAGFVQSFRDVLAGDREALERTYRMRFDRPGDGEWKLTLTPKGPPLTRFLKKMVLEGEDARVDTMKMVQANGDVTRTEFFEVRVHDWSDTRVEDVFRIE